MAEKVGDGRVLTALADTVPGLTPVDLSPNDVAQGQPALSTPQSRYVERDEIGRGGLGVVLEAFDQDLRCKVAIKRPREDRMTSASIISLIREAQITAQLDHPNIPAVHLLGVDSARRPFFSMTRLGGRSLAELLASRGTDPQVRAALTVPRLLRIVLQVGYALAFAHDRGVVHRDIKPDNVIIGEFGEIRLVDWGIAKVIGQPDQDDEPVPVTPPTTSVTKPETREGAFVGTLGYAPPEQVAGRRDLDARADVYALGAMVYEMLAGRPPVVGDTVGVVADKTLAGEIDPIKQLAPVSDGLAAIVHKALATRCEDRYGSVLAMLADVEALLEGRSVSAHAEGALARTRRVYFSRSPRMARLKNVHIDLLCWASFLLGISLGIGIAVYEWLPLDATSWATMVLALLCAVPSMVTLLRKPRADDPGVVLPLTEGLVSDGSRSTGGEP